MVSVQVIPPVIPTRAATYSAAVEAENQPLGTNKAARAVATGQRKTRIKLFPKICVDVRKLASHSMYDVIHVPKDAEREAAKWWTQENRQGRGGKAAPINRVPIDLADGAYRSENFHPNLRARQLPLADRDPPSWSPSCIFTFVFSSPPVFGRPLGRNRLDAGTPTKRATTRVAPTGIDLT